MSKRIKKIINTSFLILFLLGYIGTIVPSSTVATLFDLKVYAEGEEEPGEEEITTEAITSVALENISIPTSINSNEFITQEWMEYTDSFESEEYESGEPIQWFDNNGVEIFTDSPLNNSSAIYGHFHLNALDFGENASYVFDLNKDNVTFNGNPVYDINVFDSMDAYFGGNGLNTGLEVIVKVDVISTGGPTLVNTLKVNGAILNYEAGDTPRANASSLESSKYTISEAFLDSNQNAVTEFAAGNSYQYRLTVTPTSSDYSITEATTLELNGTTYDLVFSGENQNATIDGDSVVFYGINIVIAEAQISNTLTIQVLNYNQYDNNMGTFIFGNGTMYLKINGTRFTGPLTNGYIVVEGEEADIQVFVGANQGWTYEVQIDGASQESKHITENAMIDIVFNPELSYTLEFNTNGGTFINAITKPEGSTIDLSKYTTSKNNYIFDGWYSDSNLTNKVTSITLNSNKTVYAKWIALTDNITINYNNPEGLKYIKFNDTTLTGNTVTGYVNSSYQNNFKFEPEEDYIFVKAEITDAEGNKVEVGPATPGQVASIDVNGSTSYTINIDMEEDEPVQVFAKLTFETNGGTNINEDNFITFDYNQTISNLDNYQTTKEGYKFDGWYLDQNLTNKVTSITMDADKTIYAKWVSIYGNINITYNNPEGLKYIKFNNTELTTNTVTGYIFDTNQNNFKFEVEEGYILDSVEITDKEGNITVVDPVIAGEVASKDVNGSTTYNLNINIEEDEPVQVFATLSFETNGGTTIEDATLDFNQLADLSYYTTTKEGYKFDGWYLDQNLTNKVTTLKMDADKTVYAKWIKKYTVTNNLTGLLSSNTNFEITNEENYVTTLSINPEYDLTAGLLDYILPISVNVKIGENNIDDVNYNSETGVLTIPGANINDNITITAKVIGRVKKPVAASTEYTFNNENIVLEVNNADGRVMEITGNDKATNAGNYTVTYTLNNATYVWEDKTTEPVVINWTIKKANINPTITITGWEEGQNPNTPVLSGNDGNATYKVEYKEKGANDSTYTENVPTTYGEYTARYTVNESDNYNEGSATCDFTITRKEVVVVKVDLPRLINKTYDYTGSEIIIDDEFNPLQVTRVGYSATSIGKYTVTYKLASNDYVWEDGTKEDKTFAWSIVPGIPYFKSNYTYNSITLNWDTINGANGYQVYECKKDDTSCKKLATVTTNTYTHKKLSFNSTHYYKVRSYAKDDNDKNINSAFTSLTKVVAKLNAPKVKATKNRYQEVKVSWGKISGAEKYYVYRCEEDGTKCKTLTKVTTNKYTDKTGSKDVTYIYKVRAYRAKKYSSYSNFAEGLRLNDNLSVSVKNTAYQTNKITIRYKDGAIKYEIQKSTDNKKWTILKTYEINKYQVIEDDSFVVTDKKAKFGKKVYYRVRAYNGVNYTAYKNKSITPVYLDAPVVEASTNRYQQVRITWNEVKGAEKYYIYKCNSKGESCKEIANTTKLTYTYKSATEGKNTYYKVRAYKAKKYSNYSELAVGFRLNDDLVVTVKNNDYLTNTITVENKEDAIRYQIYKSTDNKTFTLLDTIDQTEENVVYIDKDVKYNKKYYYRVRAYNGVNYTAYNVVNVLTTKLKKPTVSTSGTIYSPTLEVKKVSQATGYEFYHSNDNTTWTKEQKSTSLTFEKEYDESETHYYRVRAYKKIDKKTYYSDFAYVSIEDFK